ncbi:MAG: sulfatase-like hydrolase/transferase, partial [Planctomycetota bacterium]
NREHPEEPFFLWIHYWDPHDPILTPPEELLPEGLPRYQGKPRKSDLLYAAELKFLDAQFGRLLDHLDVQGLADQTIVAATADHGEGLTDGVLRHAWGFHRILYKEQIHVPLLMRGPGLGEPGAVVEGAVGCVDIAPTLFELCDVAPPADLEGQSLVSAARGGPLEPRAIYADQINGYDLNAKMLQNRPKADFLYTLVETDWKIIYRPNFPADSELYDLRSDPLEEKNVWAEHPDQVVRLLTLLAERDGWVTEPFSGGEVPTPEALAILAKLGYTGGAGEEEIASTWGWICPTADLENATIHQDRGGCEESGVRMIPIRK